MKARTIISILIALATVALAERYCRPKSVPVVVRDTPCVCPCDGDLDRPLEGTPAPGKNVAEVNR